MILEGTGFVLPERTTCSFVLRGLREEKEYRIWTLCGCSILNAEKGMGGRKSERVSTKGLVDERRRCHGVCSLTAPRECDRVV